MIMKFENAKAFLVIKYEREEWEKLESLLKQLGLQRSHTQNAWGLRIPAEYYRETSSELAVYYTNSLTERVREDYNVYDDINSPVIERDTPNLAIFRVIPNENLETVIPLPKLLTIGDINRLARVISKFLSTIFSLVLEAEVIIKGEEKK